MSTLSKTIRTANQIWCEELSRDKCNFVCYPEKFLESKFKSKERFLKQDVAGESTLVNLTRTRITNVLAFEKVYLKRYVATSCSPMRLLHCIAISKSLAFLLQAR